MDLVSINSALSALCNGQAVSMALQLLRFGVTSDRMETREVSSCGCQWLFPVYRG